MVEKSFCKVSSQFFPRVSESKELRSTFIANCFLNCFLCYANITFNILTIHGIRKTSSLPQTLKTLLLSLAISDVGVGLLGQPFYISLLAEWLQLKSPGCIAYTAFGIIVGFFSKASCFCVVAISADRFLAIHFHLRYQELVTHKRVVAVVFSAWVLSAFVSLMVLWVPPSVLPLAFFIPAASSFVLAAIGYTRVYVVLRRHKNQIQSLQVHQAVHSGEMRNFASLIKSAAGAFYVYLVFLLCFSPSNICLVVAAVYGPSISLKRLFYFSCTLAFANSSLNPVLYCWKMRHIRQQIINILRNMSWCKNRT